MIEFKDVVIYGKIWKNIEKKNLKIHYLIFNQTGPSGQKGFGSLALELELFAWGIDEAKSKENLFEEIDHFLKVNHRPESVFRILGKCALEESWSIYRQLLFLCGDPESKALSKVMDQNAKLNDLNREKDEKISEITVDYKILKDTYEKLKENFVETHRMAQL
ncbi:MULTISPECIES: hypothetical protein [Leptospira]|uniref:hypothetical protein n=1 Tax=Leptospira TaxID=171 RepID=UPI0002BD7854|nr:MULTISPECIES: hypothetical protein [Leptospira]EMJ59846.1 hypothetical protein LEP1GSC051_2284 [Leptospira sp. P2653]